MLVIFAFTIKAIIIFSHLSYSINKTEDQERQNNIEVNVDLLAEASEEPRLE